MIEVLDGLRSGTRIVVEGVVKLRDGMAVQTGPVGKPAGG
jgi:multidrug efflux pump subunit AcrA (membrane-fusion protein)